MNQTIVALKSEALKERHWKSMMKELNVVWVMSDLTLGSVWAVDLLKNELIVNGIITTAQVCYCGVVSGACVHTIFIEQLT